MSVVDLTGKSVPDRPASVIYPERKAHFSMKIKSVISVCILVAAALIFSVCRPTPAFAVSTVTISSSGNGVYLLQGSGIEDAAALEINISYDAATLSNPRVVEGPLVAGAMTAVNPNIPGTVRIVMIRLTPFRGSGVIASVTFDLTGASPGRIIAMSVRLADAKGSPLAALVQVNNPSEAPSNASSASAPQDQNQASGSASTQAGAATAGSTPATAPTVIIAGQTPRPDAAREPADAPQPGEKDAQSPVQSTDSSPGKKPADVARAFDAAAGAEIPPAPEKTNVRKIYGQKSVLELFQNYKGERTAEALFALFEQESMIGFRQDPPVVLSDGKSAVKVVFISTPGDLTTSDISVMGARLISLRRDMDNTNTWVAELLPERGGYRASMAVSRGGLQMIYPLTVAPKIDLETGQAGKPSKADFDRYLKQTQTSRPTGKNASNEKTRDDVKDYITAVNYFAAIKKMTSPSAEPSVARKNR